MNLPINHFNSFTSCLMFRRCFVWYFLFLFLLRLQVSFTSFFCLLLHWWLHVFLFSFTSRTLTTLDHFLFCFSVFSVWYALCYYVSSFVLFCFVGSPFYEWMFVNVTLFFISFYNVWFSYGCFVFVYLSRYSWISFSC